MRDRDNESPGSLLAVLGRMKSQHVSAAARLFAALNCNSFSQFSQLTIGELNKAGASVELIIAIMNAISHEE